MPDTNDPTRADDEWDDPPTNTESDVLRLRSIFVAMVLVALLGYELAMDGVGGTAIIIAALLAAFIVLAD